MSSSQATIKIKSIHIAYKQKARFAVRRHRASEAPRDRTAGLTQREMVFNYMKKHGSITQIDAIRDLGCTRLGARIWDLIHLDGVRIDREMVPGINRFGKLTSFARYWLAED